MPNFLDVAAGVVTVPKDGYGTETALNVGPGSLYYKAGSTVSSTSNDGTLTSGSSLSLTGPTSFVAVSQGARLVVSDPQFDEAASLAASVAQAGGVASLDAGGQVPASQLRNASSGQIPGLLYPIAGAVIPTSGQVPGQFVLKLVRCIVPKAGTLHNLSVWSNVQNGNVIVCVYDTGDALAGSYTRLYASGSVVLGAAGAYQNAADPALAVTAGQHLMLGVISDSTTAQIGRVNVAGGAVFPTGFVAVPGGASPKMAGTVTQGSLTTPATIAEASLAVDNNVWAVIASVT